jgi:hypothetical protein
MMLVCITKESLVPLLGLIYRMLVLDLLRPFHGMLLSMQYDLESTILQSLLFLVG